MMRVSTGVVMPSSFYSFIMKRIIVILLAIVAVSAVAQEQKKPVNPDVYYARRATLFDLLPVYSSDIIMLGNSLTDGAEWNELFNNCHVKNRGIVGDIIPGFYERMEPILKGQPRKIFVLGGINDISHRLSADSVASAMNELLTLIQTRCPNTELYVQSILPFNNEVRLWKSLQGCEAVVPEANAKIKKLCQIYVEREIEYKTGINNSRLIEVCKLIEELKCESGRINELEKMLHDCDNKE